MDITTKLEEGKAIIEIAGKLTVNTSPDLSAAVEKLPSDVSDIVLDLTGVDYIASAGLRVLVSTEKLTVKRGGKMIIEHPCDEVMDVFEMTGLSEVFTIER